MSKLLFRTIKNPFRNFGFIILFIFCASIAYAQQGIGTDTPNKSAALDIKSEKRGLLIPRVELSSLTNYSPITENQTNSLLVYNTEDVDDDLYQGYYYWNDNKWNRLINQEDLDDAINNINPDLGPWYKQETTTPTTDNDDDIYQSGNVAVGKMTGYTGSSLDVEGSIRGGTNPQGDVGDNSIAVGDGLEASGNNSVSFGKENVANKQYSMAIGFKSKATGEGAFAGGARNTNTTNTGAIASGRNSFAFGMTTEASKAYSFAFGFKAYAQATESFAFGSETTANGDQSFAFGNGTEASGKGSFAFGRHSSSNATKATSDNSFAFGKKALAQNAHSLAFGLNVTATNDYEVVFGRNNKTITGSIFQIGNASSGSSSAITLMNDGQLAIGVNADPTAQLDIGDMDGEGKVRIRKLPNTPGSESDKIVVVDEDGVLKSRESTASQSAMPKFFHMPAYHMPLDESMVDDEYSFVNASGTEFTIDLYKIYQDQFSLQGNSFTSSQEPGYSLPVLDDDNLIYNVTYYDSDVFTITGLTQDGKLKYTLVNDAQNASARTYMNIVFEVKED